MQKQEGDFPFQISTFLSFAQSEVQRRPPDSYWRSGQGEDPAGAAEAAHRTPHGKREAAAKRNGLFTSTYSQKTGWR
ncbi:hypothetical protein [Rossellomorea sp. RS05]|uniref:hypothetical protein n=1 Tax=Rossellomorea sp. RS05 TaxID=3149166 RepID=UPI003221682E